ncbi:Uncharacterised protein [Vibrio cholerae]|nr:Uncharacterised protein [Vibrio cholerae]CSI67683.1 Uncharacterised protein [Vibrio cholerae]
MVIQPCSLSPWCSNSMRNICCTNGLPHTAAKRFSCCGKVVAARY